MKKVNRILKNDSSRAFITLKTNNIAANTKYLQSVGVDSFQQTKDGTIKIEVPDDRRYANFIDIGVTLGELSRLTTTLQTHMIRTDKSFFYELFNNNCLFDLHIHSGSCDRPSDFYSFDKAIILTDVLISNFDTDPLTIIQSADRGMITESIDISAIDKKDFLPLDFRIVNTFVGDILSRLILLPDLPCINDLCNSCFCFNISVLNGTAPMAGNAVLNNDLLLVQEGGVVALLDIDNILNNHQVGFTFPFNLNTTLLTVSSNNDIAIIGGINGYLVSIDKNLKQIDLSGLTNNNIVASDSKDNCFLIGTNNGELFYSTDAFSFNQINSPTVNEITAINCYGDRNFIIGDITGKVYYTNDKGISWSEIFINSFDRITSIENCGLSNIYITTSNKLYYSFDYGSEWKEEIFNNLISIDSAICCNKNINTVYVVGIDINGDSILYRS